MEDLKTVKFEGSPLELLAKLRAWTEAMVAEVLDVTTVRSAQEVPCGLVVTYRDLPNQ